MLLLASVQLPAVHAPVSPPLNECILRIVATSYCHRKVGLGVTVEICCCHSLLNVLERKRRCSCSFACIPNSGWPLRLNALLHLESYLSMYFIVTVCTIAGVHSNEDLIWCVKIGVYEFLCTSWVLITMAPRNIYNARLLKWEIPLFSPVCAVIFCIERTKTPIHSPWESNDPMRNKQDSPSRRFFFLFLKFESSRSLFR